MPEPAAATAGNGDAAGAEAGGLQVAGLVGGYGRHPVLHGIDLSLPPRRLVSLIGPNGHGKTTLLRTIAGQLKPQRGAIRLDGRDLTGQGPHRVAAAGIVHVPQGDLLFSGMSVHENLLMGAYLLRDRAALRARLDWVLGLLPKLAERRTQIADSLSGGERRMVGIARGLMAGGKVLMLDEPSLGLAPVIIDQIYDLIAVLKEAGHSILLVEESPERVQELADHVLLIDNGTVAWSGAGAELAQREELLSTYLGT